MEVIVRQGNNPEWFRLYDTGGYWITEGRAVFILEFVEKNNLKIIEGGELLD